MKIVLRYSDGRRIEATTQQRPGRGDTSLWVKVAGGADRFVNLLASSLEGIDFEAGGEPPEIQRISPR
jgi:hypothetical protein